MPLTGTESALSSSMQALLISKGFFDNEYSKLPELCDAIAEAIIPHLVANILVTTTLGAPDSEHTGNIT